MGMIFDTIAELMKLNRNPANGSKLMATEMGGAYYALGENNQLVEYKSLRELDGSEDWVAVTSEVIGFDEPEYQSMTMYYQEPDEATASDKVVAVYPHKVKTASGRTVHLAT